MNYNTSGWKFDKVRNEILLLQEDQDFWETTLGNLASGYDGTNIVTSDQDYVLTETGLKSLAERIDYPIGALKKLSPETRQIVVREMANDNSDSPVKLATTGYQIESIFSAEYEPIKNGTLMVMLDQLLPEDATVHRWYMTRDNRTLDLRVVCRDSWAVDLGNGRPDPGFGGLHIRNDELGRGALQVSLAVARVGCLNYMISSKEVLRQEHRWFSAEELAQQMRTALGSVHQYALDEAAEMRSWRDVPVEDPQLVFTQIGQDGGVPKYAMDSAREYWEEEGSKYNLFEVMQAISFGAQQINERTARGNPWINRNRIEELLLALGTESREYYAEHQHTQWEECVACHRPLETENG